MDDDTKAIIDESRRNTKLLRALSQALAAAARDLEEGRCDDLDRARALLRGLNEVIGWTTTVASRNLRGRPCEYEQIEDPRRSTGVEWDPILDPDSEI